MTGYPFWRPGQEIVLLLVLLVSIGASVAGIAYAVCCGEAGDGGRGGTIAVAVSFLALFASRSAPRDVLEMSKGSNGKPSPADPETLRTALAAMIDSQRLEKKYLAFSSVAGTLVWGFGDRVALCLGAVG